MVKYIVLGFALISVLFGCGKKDVKLEKIIFHSSQCHGSCPIYHLEIKNDQNLRLYAEEVFKPAPSSYLYDKGKMGYFTGKVNDTIFTKLKAIINDINIDSLNFGNEDCCDASVITLIIYYDGKRKFLRSMFPPESSKKLISTLFSICEDTKLIRAGQEFKIEGQRAQGY